jgi:hypothetical protein
MVIFSGLHVGLVERLLPSGAITIIAGNTASEQVARRGPAFPNDGTVMGPAAISGYVEPTASAPAAAIAARALPRPSAAQMAAQDPQDHDTQLAARERRALAGRPALEHLPATIAGVRVDFIDRAADGRTVLRVSHRSTRSHATAALRALLARYHDSGRGYLVRYRRIR